MKKLMSIMLVLVLILLAPTATFAAVKSPPEKNIQLSSIVLGSIPNFPGLELTVTNVGYLAGEIDGGTHWQTKLYCTAETTITPNKDISISPMGGKVTTIKAGASVKPMSLSGGNEVGVFSIVENGKSRLTTDTNIITTGKVYRLSFADIKWYKSNVFDEGYQATDIRKWGKERSYYPVVTINDGKVDIGADYNVDGKADFTYSITGTLEPTKAKLVGEKEIANKTDESLKEAARLGQEFPVITVKTNTKISLEGTALASIWIMDYDDGKVGDVFTPETFDWDAVRKWHMPNDHIVSAGNGKGYWCSGKGDYLQILKEGYYLISLMPFVPEHFITDTTSANFGQSIPKEYLGYNAAIIHVVG